MRARNIPAVLSALTAGCGGGSEPAITTGDVVGTWPIALTEEPTCGRNNPAPTLTLSLTVLGETGATRVHRAETPGRQLSRSAFVEAVLAAFPILELDVTVARVHARLWADLKRTGSLIGAHDLWIAATALAHSLAVMSANPRDFRRIPGLALESVSASPPPAARSINRLS